MNKDATKKTPTFHYSLHVISGVKGHLLTESEWIDLSLIGDVQENVTADQQKNFAHLFLL